MLVRCINCGFSCQKYGKTKAGSQRCIVHAVWQVHRYTTRRPKTLAGIMLRDLASDLYSVKTQEDAQIWIQRLFNWRVTFKEFLKYIDL